MAWDVTGAVPVLRRDFGAGVKTVRTRGNVVGLQLADPNASDDKADHIALWRPSTDTMVDLEGSAPGFLTTFGVSPDGRSVAVPSTADGLVRIFDAASGRLITVLPTSPRCHHERGAKGGPPRPS